MKENYFLNRKSCRFFTSQSVTKEKLKEILLKAAKAPTCGNMQLYSVISTTDPKRLKELAGYHYGQPAAKTAPMILTICADFNRFTQWCKLNKADAGFDNLHSFFTAMTDAIIFAQQIVTVAEMEGLGSCYLGTVVYNGKEISEMLKLPELVVPVASLSLGYIDKEGEETSRLTVEAILHEEEYQKKDDQKIEEFYKFMEEHPEKEKFLKENGKDNLAQVFSEVRYPRKTNELVSNTFYSLLKEKKFI